MIHLVILWLWAPNEPNGCALHITNSEYSAIQSFVCHHYQLWINQISQQMKFNVGIKELSASILRCQWRAIYRNIDRCFCYGEDRVKVRGVGSRHFDHHHSPRCPPNVPKDVPSSFTAAHFSHAKLYHGSEISMVIPDFYLLSRKNSEITMGNPSACNTVLNWTYLVLIPWIHDKLKSDHQAVNHFTVTPAVVLAKS